MSNSQIVKSDQSGKKFDSIQDVSHVVEQIKKNEDQVEVLHLEGNSYGVEPLKEIGTSLEMCHNLKHLLLNDMFTSRLKNEIPQGLAYLFDGIQASNARILTLNLNDNAIGPVTMPALLPFLKSDQSSSLENLYLNNCGLGIKGGQMLASVLADLENLTELVIGRNRLEIDGISQISLALCKLNKLERFEMPQNGSKGNAISNLCEALKQNKNLKILNLNDNVLTTTATNLAEALKNLENLQVLNLGDCLLKTQGTITILSALNSSYRDRRFSRICEINLSGNEIGKDAKQIIIATIDTILETRSDDQKPLKVDLSSNNLGEDTVNELKDHFGSVIELKIEEDQGSEDEQENENEQDISGECLNSPPVESFYDDPEKLQKHIESKYQDIDSLCRRFFSVSQQGFNPSSISIENNSKMEIEALIKVGKKRFLKNNTDFTLLNNLLVFCGLIKGENKSVSPPKKTDLSGAILALATVSKEFSFDSKQKRCIKEMLLDMTKKDQYKNLHQEVHSLIFSF